MNWTIDGEQRPVTSRYALETPAADGSVGYGFALGAYDQRTRW